MDGNRCYIDSGRRSGQQANGQDQQASLRS